MINKLINPLLSLVSSLSNTRAKVVLCSAVFAILIALPTFASTPSVAVIYPELRAPYNKIFDDIADGVEEKVNGHTKRYVIPKNYSKSDLNAWIKKNNIKVCVALGVGGEKAAADLTEDIPVLLSGVLKPKMQNNTGISLAASPDKLFELLKRKMPNVKRVHVVYNPDKTKWLIREAQSDALDHKVELVTYTTKKLAESAKIYRDLFKRPDIKNSAIWLAPDSTSIDNRALLSFVLEQAWAHDVAVFSSSPAHVKKGVLFAMYPDNMKLGLSLGKVALEELNGGSTLDSMVPVRDLKIAFNRRTAKHLGIHLTGSEMRMFDAVFPDNEENH